MSWVVFVIMIMIVARLSGEPASRRLLPGVLCPSIYLSINHYIYLYSYLSIYLGEPPALRLLPGVLQGAVEARQADWSWSIRQSAEGRSTR